MNTRIDLVKEFIEDINMQRLVLKEFLHQNNHPSAEWWEKYKEMVTLQYQKRAYELELRGLELKELDNANI